MDEIDSLFQFQEANDEKERCECGSLYSLHHIYDDGDARVEARCTNPDCKLFNQKKEFRL